MRFSASRWPAATMRSASSAPDLSVSSVRVSDTVSTAIDSGRNAGSLIGSSRARRSSCVEARMHAQVARHHDRVLARIVVTGFTSRLAVTELLVELPCGVVARTKLEAHEEDAGRPRRRLEPLDDPAADTVALIRRPHGEQAQVRVRVVKLHHAEARDPAAVARYDDRAVRVPDIPRDAALRPRPRQAVLDQEARHQRDFRRVVAPREAKAYVHESSIVRGCASEHEIRETHASSLRPPRDQGRRSIRTRYGDPRRRRLDAARAAETARAAPRPHAARA